MQEKQNIESKKEVGAKDRAFECQLQCRSGNIHFRIIKREIIDHVEYLMTIKDIPRAKEENFTLDLNQFSDLKRLMDTLGKLEPQFQAERQHARPPGREIFNEFF